MTTRNADQADSASGARFAIVGNCVSSVVVPAGEFVHAKWSLVSGKILTLSHSR
jgi:hypothetical protein